MESHQTDEAIAQIVEFLASNNMGYAAMEVRNAASTFSGVSLLLPIRSAEEKGREVYGAHSKKTKSDK